MGADQQTLKVYRDLTQDYADMVAAKGPGRALTSFIAALPKGAHVLDLGCGPADSAAHMRAAGLVPDPVDASPEMVELANKTYDIGARVATFDQIDAKAAYDGIWANFSLLHAPRTEMPRHLARLHAALKPGGLLHLGLKLGAGEHRDRLGRFYTYYTEEELRSLLSDAGFTVTNAIHTKARGLAGTLDPGILIRAHA